MMLLGSLNPNGQRCDGCIFFIGWNDLGHCRRRAPQDGGTHWRTFPKVEASDWCGEWKAGEPAWTFPHEWHAQGIVGGLRESGPDE